MVAGAGAALLGAVVRPLARGARQLPQRRAMGGHAYPTKLTPDVTINKPAPIYSTTGTVMGAIMWFWIEWRAYHDLPHMLGFPENLLEEHH